MSWLLTDLGITTVATLLLALVPIVTGALFSYRERYERQLVKVDSQRTRVEFQEGTGKPHRATLSILNTGNRATVVRDVRLVALDGATFLSYRLTKGRCDPALPFRLDAPDERAVVLELTNDEEQRVGKIDVDLLDRTSPIEWPYPRAAAAGHAGASGTLTVTPPGPPGTTTKATDSVTDSVVPALKSSPPPSRP